MAISSPSSPYAFPAEVERYFALEKGDVKRLMDEDGLPYTEVPKAKKMVRRIYLPELHAWEMNRVKGAAVVMIDYEKWVAHFNASRSGKCEVASEKSETEKL